MKNYLNTLIQNLDNGIVTIDKSYKIQTINNTFYSMFELNKECDLAHKSLTAINAKTRSLLEFSKQTLLTGKRHYEYGLEYDISAHKKIISNLSILPMEDAKGGIIGAVNVFQDVTKEKTDTIQFEPVYSEAFG